MRKAPRFGCLFVAFSLLAAAGSAATVAVARSVTTRTIRNHRDAVVHRLRRAALAAA